MREVKVVTGALHRVRRGRGKGFSRQVPTPPFAQRERPTRAAITLAFAHLAQRAIDRGQIRDQAELARLLGVSRARITQLIRLVLLAPEEQDRILAKG